jgi:hypothetical protein
LNSLTLKKKQDVAVENRSQYRCTFKYYMI